MPGMTMPFSVPKKSTTRCLRTGRRCSATAMRKRERRSSRRSCTLRRGFFEKVSRRGAKAQSKAAKNFAFLRLCGKLRWGKQMSSGILVFIENKGGTANRSSFEAIAAAQAFGSQFYIGTRTKVYSRGQRGFASFLFHRSHAAASSRTFRGCVEARFLVSPMSSARL